jgi:quinol monooxygenase YgiN
MQICQCTRIGKFFPHPKRSHDSDCCLSVVIRDVVWRCLQSRTENGNYGCHIAGFLLGLGWVGRSTLRCLQSIFFASALLPLTFYFLFLMKGVIAVVAYRLKPDKETELLELVRNRVPTPLKEGLVTNRKPTITRSRDGTIVEVSEWKSQEAIDAAHKNPNVLAM